MPASYELGQEIVDLYRGTDVFIKKQSGGKASFVDIDVAPDNKVPSIDSFEEAIGGFEAVNKRLSGIDAESRFLRARMDGTIFYLGYVAGIKTCGFDALLAHTLGVGKPTYTDAKLVVQGHKQIHAMLSEYGREHGVELGYGPEYFDAFHETFDVPEDELEAKVHKGAKAAGELLSQRVILPPGVEPYNAGEDLEVRVEKIDELYVGGFFTDPEDRHKKYVLNSDPRHKHTDGALDLINTHEMSHGYEFGLKEREIAAGRMNPVHGITTFHGPEILQAEFNAQAAEQVLPAITGKWEHLLHARMNNHQEMVWNNAHIAINHGYESTKVESYLRKTAPMQTPENQAKSLEARVSNIGPKIYSLAYEATLRLMRPDFMRWSLDWQLQEIGKGVLTALSYPQMSARYDTRR